MKRGFALAAAVLSSALVVTGCARDTGTPSTGGGATAGGTECTRNAAPTVAGGAASTAPALAKSDASGLRVGLAYDIGGRGGRRRGRCRAHEHRQQCEQHGRQDSHQPRRPHTPQSRRGALRAQRLPGQADDSVTALASES